MSPAELQESKGDILDRLRDVVAQQLSVDKEKVGLKSHFISDLGADSLDTVELVMAIEDEFSIEISDEDAEKIHTVEEAIKFIGRILNQ